MNYHFVRCQAVSQQSGVPCRNHCTLDGDGKAFYHYIPERGRRAVLCSTHLRVLQSPKAGRLKITWYS